MTARSGWSAIGLALALAGAALALKYGVRLHLIGAETSMRGFQAAIGLVLALYGNMMPKSAPVCGEEGSWSRRKQSLLRLGGWLFVIAGVGYAAIWLAVPLAMAGDASMALVGTATAITLAYTLWIVVTSRRGGRPA